MMPEVGTWTVRRILEWTTAYFARKEVDPPRLSAELLLAHVLAMPRIKLYVEYDRVLANRDLTTYRELVQPRPTRNRSRISPDGALFQSRIRRDCAMC